MRSLNRFIALASIAVLPLAARAAAPEPGQTAPDFSVQDSQGHSHRLSDYRGKYVVLEWFNNKCPFVRKHYDSGHMQALQKRYTAKGVVWFSVLSSAPGKEGYADAAEANREKDANHSLATAMLLDPDGQVGLAYGAKNTPAMYVIGPDGKLIYRGAIDDRPTTDLEDVAPAHNYVSAVLEAVLAGQAAPVSQTKAYGCSVKYK